MTVREAMIRGIADFHPEIPLTMSDLDWYTLMQWQSGGYFTPGAARRTAQELVAEGVLKREKRGIYRINKKRLDQVMRWMF